MDSFSLLNQDCLMEIFHNLSMNEKLKCRLICQQWKSAIDKIIIGQRYLEIYAVNSSIAVAAAQETGLIHRSSIIHSFMEHLKHGWSTSDGRGSIIEDYLEIQESSNNHQSPDVLITSANWFLSSHYWTYAFCASSSLFSSYSFAISKITTHDFFHSFCDCLWKKKDKHSVILDRENITFEKLNVLLHKFSNVNCLVIHNIDQLSDVIFFMITQHCPKIQFLSFTNCSGLNYMANNQHATLNCLTDYSWKLLNGAYPNLTSLTLRRCKLNEKQLTTAIEYFSQLHFLDISDNISVGRSVRYLGPNIQCLICGDLSNDESIEIILSNIAFGNGKNLKYLSIFGALGSLKTFNEFKRLSELELHFYTDDELNTYLSDIGMLSLNSLILEQIRCYECPSALNHAQFKQMLKKSRNLKRLQITGDFDWNLRLNDESLRVLAYLCPHLKELTLNGNGLLTDYGLLYLSTIPLVQLNLASFLSITDYSITTLIKRISTLQYVTLVDMPQITGRVITKAISICQLDKNRNIKMTFSDEKMNRIIKKTYWTYPSNLKINFDKHLCGKQVMDSEPTDIQIILIILMSLLILGMTIASIVVVGLVPLAMLMMENHDYLIEVLLSRINIFEFLFNFIWDNSSTICDNEKILFSFSLFKLFLK